MFLEPPRRSVSTIDPGLRPNLASGLLLYAELALSATGSFLDPLAF